MQNEIVSFIKTNFQKLPRVNEENVKISIVVEVLKKLGYDPATFDYEHPVYHNKGRADIAIEVIKGLYLYVETKSGDHILSDNDIIQITQYLHNRGIEWGVLTNGKEYFLINDKIESIDTAKFPLADKIVFKIDVSTNKEVKFIPYLSKEAIFDTRITNYFRDITQFRAYRYPNGMGSWNTYKGTLYNFFTFYAQKENKYRPLKEIRVDDFQLFLDFEQKQKEGRKKSINALDTFNNKYSHIRSMFSELKKRDKIGSHHFEEERKKLANNLNYSSREKEDNYLTLDNIKKALMFLGKTENSTRNLVIFLFSIYMGFERSALRNLSWSMINKTKKTILIDQREIPLPNKLVSLLEELHKETKEKSIKGTYLFYAYYGKKHKQITETGINAIFDSLTRIDEKNKVWSCFSPQYIRNCLVKRLFENGYAIEEIAYLVGIDLVNISNLISFDEVCSNVNLKKQRALRKHPFSEVLK